MLRLSVIAVLCLLFSGFSQTEAQTIREVRGNLIWSEWDAKAQCPGLCQRQGMRWTGRWRHLNPNETFCSCEETDRRGGYGPQPQYPSGVYYVRWDRVGGGWSTHWMRENRPHCPHFDPACDGPGQSYCGWYRHGQVALWWKEGRHRTPWTIRCSVRAD